MPFLEFCKTRIVINATDSEMNMARCDIAYFPIVKLITAENN